MLCGSSAKFNSRAPQIDRTKVKGYVATVYVGGDKRWFQEKRCDLVEGGKRKGKFMKTGLLMIPSRRGKNVDFGDYRGKLGP